MYRVAVWGTLFTIVLTLGVYLIEYFNPNELQEWCKKSCFRHSDQTGPYFKSHVEECSALYGAFKTVMKGEDEPENKEEPKKPSRRPWFSDECLY